MSFCSSGRDFASGFLQIPPHGGHPCPWLTVPTAKPVVDFHHQVMPMPGAHRKKATASILWLFSNGLLRGQDLNLRPSGYEPDELPDCSTPRQYKVFPELSKTAWQRPTLTGTCVPTTIGAEKLNFRVRTGTGVTSRYRHQTI